MFCWRWLWRMVAACALLVPGVALSGDGSNLGGQATHYEPPLLSGSVTLGGSAAEGAEVGTLAAQATVTDAGGDYALTIDAPGIYRVSARVALNSASAEVEVFTGMTTVVDFDLGDPCPVAGWPDPSSVATMITCINGNFARTGGEHE